MSIFEKLMSLIEQYGEGEVELEDIILFGGLEIPYHVETESNEDFDGNVYEHEYIVYDYQYATADRSYFTEEQSKEIEEAFAYARQNIEDYEGMCESALIDWNA